MDAWKKEALIEAGIDVDDVLGRFMGNEALLSRFLKKFLDDANYGKLLQAITERDADAAVAASHTLKGVCGNLSMTGLYDLLTRQVAALRDGNWDAAAGLMPEISQAYETIVLAIQRSARE